jgi:hypothetical protein
VFTGFFIGWGFGEGICENRAKNQRNSPKKSYLLANS